MLDVADEGLRTSLEATLGHAAPFQSEELANLRQLLVTGARALAEVAHCTALEELVLCGCEVADPGDVLPGSLKTIRIVASTVETLGFLRRLQSLVEVEINYCLVQDIEPLLSLPALRRARLTALPLERRSYEEVRQRLEGQPLGEGRPPVVACSAAAEWRTTRDLFERGLGVCYGTLDGPYDGPLLVRPGIAKGLVKPGDGEYSPTDVVDWAEITPDAIPYVFSEVGERPSTEVFTGGFLMQRPVIARGAARFQSTLVLGDAADARGWIAAARTSDEAKKALTSFVDRFPQQVFHRDREEIFGRLEAAGVRYPMWFKLLRTKTLGFVGRDRRAMMRFEEFEVTHSPRTQYAEKIWYRLSLNPVGDPDTQKIWTADCGAQPFATWPAENRSTLCLSVNSQYDMRVFEAAEADLWDAKHEKGDPMKSIYNVFVSWTSMLSRIVEVKLEG